MQAEAKDLWPENSWARKYSEVVQQVNRGQTEPRQASAEHSSCIRTCWRHSAKSWGTGAHILTSSNPGLEAALLFALLLEACGAVGTSHPHRDWALQLQTQLEMEEGGRPVPFQPQSWSLTMQGTDSFPTRHPGERKWRSAHHLPHKRNDHKFVLHRLSELGARQN